MHNVLLYLFPYDDLGLVCIKVYKEKLEFKQVLLVQWHDVVVVGRILIVQD